MERLAEDQEFVSLIIKLNTQDQLFKKGIDSTGGSIGSYAPETILQKEAKGQPTDRVTLKDSGDFYRSWKVYLTSNYDLQITATDEKAAGLIFKYGEDILGLTAESLGQLVELGRKKVQEIFKQELLKAA